jgi:hypothetical protein
MASQMQRFGYFWLTIERDCVEYVRKYHKCQIYVDKTNTPLAPLNMWGLDVIGPINQKTNNGHRFILVPINYFTKWVEVSSYAHVT